MLRCAVVDDATRGRRHPEAEGVLRTPFELDRHRILNCTAFRRVRSKTQVFSQAGQDHFRTRLTHTLEVAEIARLIARNLGINATLAHTIALAHDLGHPPFGHAGEAALAERMRDHGGFEHNAHSLRVVDYLEHPYPAFRGLNLTYEVREGLLKHVTPYDHPAEPSEHAGDPATVELLASGARPSAEAQAVDLADRLAYDLHDIEDALGAGLLDPADIAALDWWSLALASADPLPAHASLHAIRRPVLDRMLDLAVADLVAASGTSLAGLANVDDVRRSDRGALGFSTEMAKRIDAAEEFLLERVYRTERVRRSDEEARRMITQLFEAYLRRPEVLPARFASRITDQGLHGVVCDYVAGMTDRFCEAEWARWCTCASS